MKLGMCRVCGDLIQENYRYGLNKYKCLRCGNVGDLEDSTGGMYDDNYDLVDFDFD